jgi:hypothetical protein
VQNSFPKNIGVRAEYFLRAFSKLHDAVKKRKNVGNVVQEQIRNYD